MLLSASSEYLATPRAIQSTQAMAQFPPHPPVLAQLIRRSMSLKKLGMSFNNIGKAGCQVRS